MKHNSETDGLVIDTPETPTERFHEVIGKLDKDDRFSEDDARLKLLMETEIGKLSEGMSYRKDNSWLSSNTLKQWSFIKIPLSSTFVFSTPNHSEVAIVRMLYFYGTFIRPHLIFRAIYLVGKQPVLFFHEVFVCLFSGDDSENFSSDQGKPSALQQDADGRKTGLASVTKNMPAKQRALFMRIQQKQAESSEEGEDGEKLPEVDKKKVEKKPSSENKEKDAGKFQCFFQ